MSSPFASSPQLDSQEIASAPLLEAHCVAVASPSETIDVDNRKVSDTNEEDMVTGKENEYVTETMSRCIEEPKEGMCFDTVDSLVSFYREYGNRVGFNVSKRSTSKGDTDFMRYITLVCFRSGKGKTNSKNILKPRPIRKTMCQAKVNAKLLDNRKWQVTGVTLDHNHTLSPEKSRMYRSNREIKPHVKRKLLLNSKAGIRMNQSMSVLAVEANGHENFTFIEKDARNFIDKQRRLNLNHGDAEASQNYFTSVQATDSNFFFVIDLDDDGRLRNVFWSDARSRAAYEEFGDVITFDTTYLTNRYDMPFAPFVGVNHHGQSILLGCGLVSREDTDTFVWLFKSWLASVSYRSPSAIITDQDRAMRNAIQLVFPNARHRWCLWHILKKLPEKFGGHMQYKAISFSIRNIVYDSLSHIEFETRWIEMIEKYELSNNEWLAGLYDERRQWVPCFVKDCFWAGMSTTQRSESMNSFFDGYVNSKMTLKQFVEKYEHALRSKVRKEKEEDINSFNTWIPCITIYLMEQQVQEAYTTSKFKEFQVELTGKMYCEVSPSESCGATLRYDVSEDRLVGEEMKNVRRVKFEVCLVKEEEDLESEVKCNCCLFEFRGILSRHAIAVLIKEEIHSIPSKYILRRWRKDIKRCHTKVKVSYSDWSSSEEGRRHDKMCRDFNEVADLAFQFEGKCNMVHENTAALKQKLIESNDSSKSSPLLSSKILGKGISKECKSILTPLAVRCKGRPVKRLQSKVEQEVEKAKKRKNKLEFAEKNANVQQKKKCSTRKGTEVTNAIGTREVAVKNYQSTGREQAGDVLATQESIPLGESQVSTSIQKLDGNLSLLSFTQELHYSSQMQDCLQQNFQRLQSDDRIEE